MAKVQRYETLWDPATGDEEFEDEHRWRLRDNNGEIIAQGQAYESSENVQRGVNNVALEFAKLYFEAADAKHIDVAALENFEEWPVIDIPIEDV